MRRVAASVAAWLVVQLVADAQRSRTGEWMGVLDEHPAIEYATRPTHDPVARLNAALEAGQSRLEFDASGEGYLRSVLRALDVSASSQMLVLSRTGVQRHVTSPKNPRALYFNEDVAVGFIGGSSFLELVAQDPRQGPVFYTLDQRSADRPAFSRQTSCLSCHVTTATLEVPGWMTRSLVARPDGTPSMRFESGSPDHRTPFAARWGGWFVTGAPATLRHRGNVVVDAAGDTRTLAPGTPSDVVALALFDHQTRGLNLLTRVAWEARVAEHEGTLSGATTSVSTLLDELAAYLTFADEAPLPAPLVRSAFADWFGARGPRDPSGRSLHELDLRTRLLKYPCSYLVDSPAMAALPTRLRAELFRRIGARLKAGTPDHVAALEILKATNADARLALE